MRVGVKEIFELFKQVASETDFSYLVEHILQLVLGECRALNILYRPQVFSHALTILLSYWLHPLFCQLFADAGIIAEIRLRTDDQARNAWTMVVHLWEPFFTDVLE